VALALLVSGTAVNAQTATGDAVAPEAPAAAVAPAATGAADQAAMAAADQAMASSASLYPPPTFSARNPRYVLRPGDVMDISFEYSPEFNQTGVSVQPDGFISLRSVGDLKVAGQTLPEAKQMITLAYSKFLHEPNVDLVLKDFERPYFVASGWLAHPGKYEIRGDTTLTEAVAIAGGFTSSSKHSQVVLYRRLNNDWMQAKVFDVKKMLASHDLREDVHLQPGDMVYVPQNRLSKMQWIVPRTSAGLSTAYHY
jgi:polysaccharide export outer membrane protein